MRAVHPLSGIGADLCTTPSKGISSNRLGDHAARRAADYACNFLDYTYVCCPNRESGGMRYRPGFESLCNQSQRRLPLYLDSAAYSEFTGGAPKWSGYDRYLEAIDLLHPDGAMAKDVVGNQDISARNYERMCADGYRDVTIPVWQVMPEWDPDLSIEANAALAAQEPTLRRYCDRAPLVAVVGLNQSPCRRPERHLYLQVLCQRFRDTQFWGLGQANPVVVNALGSAQLLGRVWRVESCAPSSNTPTNGSRSSNSVVTSSRVPRNAG